MRKIFILLAAAVLYSLTGCQQQQKKSVNEISGQPDIRLSAVAQFLRQDNSKYLTQQQYEIYFQPKTIVITADEPFGKVVWSVENGNYTIKNNGLNKISDKELYDLMTDKAIAQGLLELYLAGLNKIPIGQTGKEQLNFDGQLYESVAQTGADVSLYRNKSTGKSDLVASGKEKGVKMYLIYGYNYRKMGKIAGQDNFYPCKIDIYIYHTGSDKELIAQISCTLR